MRRDNCNIGAKFIMQIAYWVSSHEGSMELISGSKFLFRVYSFGTASANYVCYGYSQFAESCKKFDNLDEAMRYGTTIVTSGGYRVLTEREMNLL